MFHLCLLGDVILVCTLLLNPTCQVFLLPCPPDMLAFGDLFLLQEIKRNPPTPVNFAGSLVCAHPRLIQGQRFKFKFTNHTEKSL